MPRPSRKLRRDALAIWQAGVAAVGGARLVREAVKVRRGTLVIGQWTFDLARLRQIVVVGAGKAGAGMAQGLEAALGPELARRVGLSGLINVPADCLRPLGSIRLHAAREPGQNEPTPEGEAGARAMLELVGSLGPDDLCLALISGGGSALMPAPCEGITLDDKLSVTRHLSAAGANIEELNAVRKQLSRIKGGGLARACRAGWLVGLVISDVLGDPLDVIASGPTVPAVHSAADALAVLERFDPARQAIPARVWAHLERRAAEQSRETRASSAAAGGGRTGQPMSSGRCRVENLVIGNVAVAVDAAGCEARRLGYAPALEVARRLEGQADEVGRRLAGLAVAMRDPSQPDCLISGGEPVVRLCSQANRGRGGRNQQLVLAAAERLAADGGKGLVLLSGGTDGEDGPTDAAGAVVDAEVLERAEKLGLDFGDYLARNDSYRFFEVCGGLIKTGPTNTNVGDLRVVLAARRAPS